MIQARFGSIRVIPETIFTQLQFRGELSIQSLYGYTANTLYLPKFPELVFIQNTLSRTKYKRLENLSKLFPHLAIEETLRA